MSELSDPIYRYLQSLVKGTKIYLLRDRDGMPLAKGYSRAQLERTGDVFRSLGIPCRVVRYTTGNPGVHQGETEPRAEFLRRDREHRQRQHREP